MNVWRCTYTPCDCVHKYLALGLSEFSGDTLLGVLWWCALEAGGLTRPTPPTPELWKVEENEEEDEEEGSELDDEGGSWLLAKSCVMICCKTERKSEGNDREVT